MPNKDELLKQYKDLTGEDFGEGTNAEIEAAIKKATPAPSETKATGSYVAVQPFRDKFTKKMYAKGDTISKSDEATTKARLDAKLIKKA